MKRLFKSYSLVSQQNIHSQALTWAYNRFSCLCYLNSNNHTLDPYSEQSTILAAGVRNQMIPAGEESAFEKLKNFTEDNQDWLFGFFSYDLKNQLENLQSLNPDGIKMPLMHFFVPEVLIIFTNDEIKIGLISDDSTSKQHEKILEEILETSIYQAKNKAKFPKVKHRVSKTRYLETVQKIKKHIHLGDIYEANFCIEFYSQNIEVDPLEVYLSLNAQNPSPFSCFYKLNDKYLISSSPERFLAKRGQKLISQPIKGTIRRGKTPEEDLELKNQLLNDPKERSENVMIVDLVRNDLSHTAENGSVKVEELFGIYTYPKVHQMISTVTSLLKKNFHFTDAIKFAFPMGSMTGAPKIRAMELMEKYENTRRGLYSGAVGYFSPDRNFDFNVIIRSILYNQSEKYLSFMAGSAITADSDPLKEYQECLLKAESMAQAIKPDARLLNC